MNTYCMPSHMLDAFQILLLLSTSTILCNSPVILIFHTCKQEKTEALNQQFNLWITELELHMQETLVTSICPSVFEKNSSRSPRILIHVTDFCGSCKCIRDSFQTSFATVGMAWDFSFFYSPHHVI
jgi:hypothetical protein